MCRWLFQCGWARPDKKEEDAKRANADADPATAGSSYSPSEEASGNAIEGGNPDSASGDAPAEAETGNNTKKRKKKKLTKEEVAAKRAKKTKRALGPAPPYPLPAVYGSVLFIHFGSFC